MAPDRRSEALDLLKDDKDENIFTATLKFLLGDPAYSYTEEDIPQEKLDKSLPQQEREEKLARKALITAAIRVRNPKSDPIHYELDKYPQVESNFRTRFVKRNTDNDFFPLYYIHKPFLQPAHYENKWVTALVRWRMTVFPSQREPLFWNSLHSLLELVEAGGNYGAPPAFLETLLDPCEPPGKAATAATLTALVAKQPALSMLAQDILIAAIGDGRLEAPCLTEAVSFHLRNELSKFNRWLKPLSVIADVSSDHAGVIRQMLETVLPDFPAKQLGPFLNLLYELSVATETGISDTKTREFLTKLSGSAAKAAKKILSIP